MHFCSDLLIIIDLGEAATTSISRGEKEIEKENENTKVASRRKGVAHLKFSKFVHFELCTYIPDLFRICIRVFTCWSSEPTADALMDIA